MVTLVQSFVLGKGEQEGSGMAMRTSCIVNTAPHFTASRGTSAQGRLGEVEKDRLPSWGTYRLWALHWQRHWRCLQALRWLRLREFPAPKGSLHAVLGDPGHQLRSTTPLDSDFRSQTSLGVDGIQPRAAAWRTKAVCHERRQCWRQCGWLRHCGS